VSPTSLKKKGGGGKKGKVDVMQRPVKSCRFLLSLWRKKKKGRKKRRKKGCLGRGGRNRHYSSRREEKEKGRRKGKTVSTPFRHLAAVDPLKGGKGKRRRKGGGMLVISYPPNISSEPSPQITGGRRGENR